jgi:hypothetical protein
MEPSVRKLTIPRDGALSAPVELTCDEINGIVLPNAWDPAGLSFSVSIDGARFHDVYDSDGEVTISADIAKPDHFVSLDLEGVRFLKVRSGTGGSPVNQSQERVLLLVVTSAS